MMRIEEALLMPIASQSERSEFLRFKGDALYGLAQVEEAMNAYLTWEINLAHQMAWDDDKRFRILR